MADAQGLTLNIGQQPDVSTTFTGPSSSTTKKKKTADVLAAEQQLGGALEQSNLAAENQRQMAADFAAREEELRQKDADAAFAQAAEIADAQEKQKQIWEEQQARRAELLKQEQAQQEEVDKAAAPSGYWQNMSTPRRILAVISMGMGGAVGSDTPMKIFQMYADEDKAVKMAKYEKEAKKLIRMGANREAVLQGYKEREAQIEREHATNLKLLSKQAEIAAKTIPGASERATMFKIEAEKELSDRLVKNAETRVSQQNAYAPSTTSESGKTSTTVNSQPNKDGSQKSTEAQDKAAAQSKLLGDSLDVLEQNVDIIPDVVDKMSANVTQLEGNSEAAKSGVIVPGVVAKLRKWGALPQSAFDGINEEYGVRGENVAGANEAANEAVMRWLSGGAITGNFSKDEEGRARRGFTHIPGESAERAKQVNKNLRVLENTLASLGGAATAKISKGDVLAIASGGTPSALASPQVTQATKQPAQPKAPERVAYKPQELAPGISKALKIKPGEPGYEDAQEFLNTYAPGAARLKR